MTFPRCVLLLALAFLAQVNLCAQTPSLVTGAATNVTDLNATLSGTVTPNTSGYVYATFDYGTTVSYGNTATGNPYSNSGSNPVTFTANPSGLQPNTTYHYRAKGLSSGTYYYGSDATFTTDPPATPPTMSGNCSSFSISASTATLEGGVAFSGSSTATLVFEYGLTTAYGSSSTYSSSVTPNSTVDYPEVTLTGLASATTYHFHCKITNAQGSAATPDATLTTLATPVVVTGTATGVTDLNATLNGSVKPNGGYYSLYVNYGATTSYGATVSANPSSASGSGTTNATATPTGLLPSTTYHFRMAAYDSNAGYTYGGDQTFTTSAPATPPTVGNISSSSVTATTATVQASNVTSGSSTTTVYFDYGFTNTYGSTITYSPQLATNTSNSFLSTGLTGLTPSTTYHFRCRAANGQGTANSSDATFTTLAAPVVTTGAATLVTDLTATLNGTASPNGGTMSISMDYGTTTNYGFNVSANPVNVSGSSTTSVTASLTGLQPLTAYHYRIKGLAGGGVYYYGVDMTFTTNAPATPPTVGTVSSFSITATQAYVEDYLVTAGSSPATVYFDYGPTTSYGSTVAYSPALPTSTNLGDVDVPLNGLTPGTLYHYRCRAVNGQGSAASADAVFTTLPAPIITTAAATSVTDLAATLTGTVNPSGGSVNVQFDFGTTTSYGTTVYPTTNYYSGSNTSTVSAGAPGVPPNTTYHYRFHGYDYAGINYYGSDMAFTTAAPATPPTVGTLSSTLTASTATLRVSSVYSGSSPATVQFEYGFNTSYGSIAPYSSTLATNTTTNGILASLTGLLPNTVYHYRCDASNGQGVTLGTDATFTTLASPVVTSAPASGVTDIHATFNGTANASGGQLYISFDYGTNTSYGNTIYPSPDSITGSSTSLVTGSPSGLLPNTNYHYRLKGYDNAGIYYYGTDMTFTTAPPATPPTLTTGGTSFVGATSATVTATNVATGSSQTLLVFDYGPTASYGSSVADATPLLVNTAYASLGVTLTGLAPGTIYHYRTRAANNEGTAYGADATFTTLPLPTVTTGGTAGVTDLAATLNGTANANTGNYTASFDYGTTTTYGSSVNATPSSVSGTSSTGLTASPTGLLPATTYHYRLKLTDAVTSFYGADAVFTTLAPGTPPTVTTTPAAGVTGTTATLNATGLFSGSSPAAVAFQYGPTGSYGTTIPYLVDPTNNSNSSISVVVSGLQPLTTYHFQAVATNAQGTALGGDLSFTTLGPPSVTTNPATNITDLAATLNATVNPLGVTSTVSFDYGLSTSYGSNIAASSPGVSGSTNLASTITLTGLSPLTTYHYRCHLSNVDGTYYGNDATFTTFTPGTPPSIASISTGTPGATNVTLSASQVGAGSSPATVVFDYGLTPAYGTQVTYSGVIPASTIANPSVNLSGLSPGTTYHYRARAINSQGTAYAADSTFQTSGVPILTTGPASAIADITATLNGNGSITNGYLFVHFEYGTTTAYGTSVYPIPDFLSSGGVLNSSATISGLSPNTTYHYRLSGYDGADVIYYGADVSFVTGPPTTPPTVTTGIASVLAKTATVTAANVTAGGSPATVSWNYGLTTAYGSSVTFATPISILSYSSTLSGSLTGLTPGTTYHYQAVITNAQTTVYGADAIFTTSAIFVSATTLPATQLRSTSATLNGSYQANADISTVTFEYGLDATYGTTINATPVANLPGTVSAALTGLEPGTTYHFRVDNTNPNGVAYGADLTFMTSPANAPVAVTGTALGSTTGAAIFRGTVNATNSSTTPLIEYGLTTSYGSIAGALPAPVTGSTDTAVSTTVSGLTANSIYHYRVVATNIQGTAYGDDAIVQMVQPPQIAFEFAFASAQGALLEGSVTTYDNAPTVDTAYFEYGLTTAYGSTTTPFQLYSLEEFSQLVSAEIGNLAAPPSTPLQPNTTYHYHLVATGAGGTVYGNDMTFTTDYTEALASYQAVTELTSTAATLNATVTEAGGTDALNFDYGLTNSYGTTLAATPSTVSGTGAFPVSLSITGLTPGTTYHYRIWSYRTSSGITTPFSDQTFTTPSLLDSWRQAYFGTTADTGATADNASFSGDGIPNLLKYALGLDPTVPATAALPPAVLQNCGGATYLSYTFPRDPTKTDLTYTVLAAGSLNGPWTTIASSVGGAATTGPGLVVETPGVAGIISVEVHDIVSTASAAQRYLRLQITDSTP